MYDDWRISVAYYVTRPQIPAPAAVHDGQTKSTGRKISPSPFDRFRLFAQSRNERGRLTRALYLAGFYDAGTCAGSRSAKQPRTNGRVAVKGDGWSSRVSMSDQKKHVDTDCIRPRPRERTQLREIPQSFSPFR